MSNQVIPYATNSRVQANTPVALDANGVPRSFTGTVSIDDYATAYVAKQGNQIYVVPKNTVVQGQTKTVTVTISGSAVSGAVIPSVVTAFDVSGPAAPPDATHFQVPLTWNYSTDPAASYPADPGSNTVSIP